MKTIEVTDEMYNSLMELSKEMITQDPLSTRMPHMFQIETTEEVAAYVGCDGDEVWVNEDGDELRSEEEIREFIQQYIHENDESIIHLQDESARSQSRQKVEEMDDWDLSSFLENLRDNWRMVEVTTMKKYANTFFTSKACKEHIKLNDYHYKKPRCYLNHAWRNPEMELVSKFLCELSGGRLHT